MEENAAKEHAKEHAKREVMVVFLVDVDLYELDHLYQKNPIKIIH
jgi:hypothetical protein